MAKRCPPCKKILATFAAGCRDTPPPAPPSSPVAQRMARKIRGNEYRPDIYIGIEFMLDKERGVWWYMCWGRISEEWVGLVHLQKHPRPSYPIHLLLFKQSESTDYVSRGTKSVSLQSRR